MTILWWTKRQNLRRVVPLGTMDVEYTDTRIGILTNWTTIVPGPIPTTYQCPRASGHMAGHGLTRFQSESGECKGCSHEWKHVYGFLPKNQVGGGGGGRWVSEERFQRRWLGQCTVLFTTGTVCMLMRTLLRPIRLIMAWHRQTFISPWWHRNLFYRFRAFLINTSFYVWHVIHTWIEFGTKYFLKCWVWCGGARSLVPDMPVQI